MNKSIFIPILLFLSFLTIVYFVLPEYSAINDFKEAIQKKSFELQLKKDHFSNLKASLEDLENYKESLGSVESALPKEFSLADLLSFFYYEAQNNGMILKSVSQTEEQATEEEEVKNKLNTIHFSIILEGSFDSFDAFLKNIENSARIIETESISVGKGSEGNLPEFSLQVKVYYY